jgi:hypothetical protein
MRRLSRRYVSMVCNLIVRCCLLRTIHNVHTSAVVRFIIDDDNNNRVANGERWRRLSIAALGRAVEVALFVNWSYVFCLSLLLYRCEFSENTSNGSRSSSTSSNTHRRRRR